MSSTDRSKYLGAREWLAIPTCNKTPRSIVIWEIDLKKVKSLIFQLEKITWVWSASYQFITVVKFR